MPDTATTLAASAIDETFGGDLGITGVELLATLTRAGYSIVSTHSINELARSFHDMPYGHGITPTCHSAHTRPLDGGPVATIGDVLWTLDNLRMRLTDAAEDARADHEALIVLRNDVAAVRRVFGIDEDGALAVARQAKAIAESVSDHRANLRTIAERYGEVVDLLGLPDPTV